jgi:UDP-glucose 4-epimerase
VNALEACRINKVKKYMFASSVYVNSKEGGFYKASKQSAEIYVEEYFFDSDIEPSRIEEFYEIIHSNFEIITRF